MVLFFAEKMQLWKTKLNKLLFYADFSMYQQTGFWISGMKYRAIDMGPVPNNFNSVFEFLANHGAVEIQHIPFPDGGTGEKFMPGPAKQFDAQFFSEKELEILKSVAARFNNTSTNEIIKVSHKEKAWVENEAKRTEIDYGFGFELS